MPAVDPPDLELETLESRMRWGKELAMKVRALRAELGLQQDELIRRSGLSRATVQNYEGGRIDHPSIDTVQAMAVGLGVDVRLLLPDDFAGRIALNIIARMEADRGKEIARLTEIAGRSPSSGRSKRARSAASSDSNAPTPKTVPINLADMVKRKPGRKRREGGFPTMLPHAA